MGHEPVGVGDRVSECSDVNTANDTSPVVWIDVVERMPPKPKTPYKVYLVWAVARIAGATGTSYLLQFSRKSRGWVGAENLVVTHWSDALDRLGYPPSLPWGPRQ